MSQQIIDRTSALVRDFDARVQATPDDAWTNQSPCDEWKARDVVVHVANNLSQVGAELTAGEALSVAEDADIVVAWAVSWDQFLTGLTTSDLSQVIASPMGPMPAEQFIGRLICTDLVVHTWDLARAVGGDEQLDQAAVDGAYSGLKPMDEMLRRPGVFGPKIVPPDGADLQTEFLCFVGRQV